MKKYLAIVFGLSLVASASFAANLSDADQKWLAAIDKKIQQGQTEISTPSEARLTLLKTWAAGKGFSTQVQKSGQNYRVTLVKEVAAK